MYWYFGILVVLSALSLSPEIVMLGFMLFLVPGLILMAAPTLLLYSTLLLPLYLSFKHPQYRIPLIVAGLVLPLGVALLPGVLARQLHDGYFRRVLAADFSKPSTIHPRTYRIPASLSGVEGRQSLCWMFCQQLLFDGGVEAVFVTFYGEWRFRIAKAGPCLETLSSPARQYQPRVLRGECLVEERVSSAEPDVEVLSSDRKSDPAKRAPDWNERSSDSSLWAVSGNVSTIEIKERHSGNLESVERVTSGLSGYVAPLPYFFGIEPMGGRQHKVAFISRRSIEAVPASVLLAKRYGLGMTANPKALSPPLSDAETIAIYKEIVNRRFAPQAVISKSESEFIDTVFQKFNRQPSLTPEVIELLRATIRQRAIFNYIGLEGLAKDHPSIVPEIIADVVARLEEPVTTQRDHVRDDVREICWKFLAQLKPDQVRPYATRLAPILADPVRANGGGVFVVRWPAIEADSSSVLLKLLENEAASGSLLVHSALKALCLSNATVSDEVVARMNWYLQKRSVPMIQMHLAVVTLARAGRRADIESFAKTVDGARAADIMGYLKAIPVGAGPEACN